MMGQSSLANQALAQPIWSTPFDDAEVFELAPIALLLEDLSKLQGLLRQWRSEGVTDLESYLREDPERILQCYNTMRIIKMNRKTRALFGIGATTDIRAGMARIYRRCAGPLIERLLFFWRGETSFSAKTWLENAQGRRIDFRVQGAVLSGHDSDWSRVLITYEDISSEELILRQLTASEQYARSVFEQSPSALMVNDLSEVKALYDGLRASGVTDFHDYLSKHDDFLIRCMRGIKILDFNQQTLSLFGAANKAELLSRFQNHGYMDLSKDMAEGFYTLWQGKLSRQMEVVNYTVSGMPLNLVSQTSIVAGCEESWALQLLALTDITARKQAEARLEFLSKHDILTGLYNRSAFLDEIARLDCANCFPVTIFMIDMDGLKEANDALGHAGGDRLLARVGKVLAKTAEKSACAARIGGDEFALVMAHAGEEEAEQIAARIKNLLVLDNAVEDGPALSLSFGASTCHGPGCLEATVRAADLRMYEAKRRFYAARPECDRRAR